MQLDQILKKKKSKYHLWKTGIKTQVLETPREEGDSTPIFDC